MLFSGVRRITAPRWQGFNSQQLHILWPTLRSATPSNFCRPATPTGSLLFAAPRPERPSDPANPGWDGLGWDGLGWDGKARRLGGAKWSERVGLGAIGAGLCLAVLASRRIPGFAAVSESGATAAKVTRMIMPAARERRAAAQNTHPA